MYMHATHCISLTDYMTGLTSSKFHQPSFFSKLHGYTSDI